MNLNIENRSVYHFDDILVINKTYDIPTRGKNLDDDDSVQFWVMKHQNEMVWAVHQLDADTTGVNIFCTRKKLVGKLQKALSDSRTYKIYYAIVLMVYLIKVFTNYFGLKYVLKNVTMMYCACMWSCVVDENVCYVVNVS